MPPKSKKQQHQEPEADKDAIRAGPSLNWMVDGPWASPRNQCPQGRCYSVGAYFEDKMYVFGGWGGSNRSKAQLDTSNAGALSPTRTSRGGPSAKAAKTVDTSRPSSTHCTEVVRFDTSVGIWTVLDSIPGEPHPGTSQAAAVELGGAVLFYGGWDGFRRHNAVTLFSLQELRWKPFPTVGDVIPPPLSFHACCGHGRRFFVFGGELNEGGYCGDLHILDLTTTQWAIAPSSGAPAKRVSHTMSVLQGSYVVVFGGRAADGAALGDVAVFDITNNHWVLGVKVNGVGPARFGHASVAVTANKILIYGGIGPKAVTSAAAPLSKGEKQPVVDQSSYEPQSDVWLLTLHKPNSVSWERVQTGYGKDGGPGPFSGMTPTPSLAESVSLSAPLQTPTPNMNRSGHVASFASMNGSPNGTILQPTSPTPNASPLPPMANRTKEYQPPGRGGHCGVIAGGGGGSSCIYWFGGRFDDIGTVTGEVLALDITPMIPRVSTMSIGEGGENGGRDTQQSGNPSENAMRPPSSTTTQ